jgi:hypothetical protein
VRKVIVETNTRKNKNNNKINKFKFFDETESNISNNKNNLYATEIPTPPVRRRYPVIVSIIR